MSRWLSGKKQLYTEQCVYSVPIRGREHILTHRAYFSDVKIDILNKKTVAVCILNHKYLHLKAINAPFSSFLWLKNFFLNKTCMLLTFPRVWPSLCICARVVRRGEGQLLMLFCWRFHSGDFGPRNAAWRQVTAEEGRGSTTHGSYFGKDGEDQNQKGSKACKKLIQKRGEKTIQNINSEHPPSFS